MTTGSDAAKPAIPVNPNPENLSNEAKAETSKPAIQVTTGFGVELSALGTENPRPPAAASRSGRQSNWV